ncbi:hypothetical protein ACFVT5_40275 [Streptomyces sp. NPDC058001]|uniref:hypothetical protein n=1 Tax=Streptomyces sp. NPDC058001 TaxID=3346300 RepID=UPI0036E8B924
MTPADGTATPTDNSEAAAPLLSDLLTQWAHDRDPGERAAVTALIEEDDLLAREGVRHLLVTEHDGTMSCDWLAFEARYARAPGLTPEDKAFLALVVAVRFPRTVTLWKLELLDDRRLCIVLRAMAKLAGSDTVAVGTRV